MDLVPDVTPRWPASPALAGLAGRPPGSADFRWLLHQFEPIGLAQMDEVALMDRTDTKYVMRASELYEALEAVRHRYSVLDIDGVRPHPYETLYFDTGDFTMYLRHHAGWRPRYKVRSRRYVESHRTFLEVKVKTNKDRTSKRRLETAALVTRLTPEASSFVDALVPVDPRGLQPRLWNSFSRVTLVSKVFPERLTLDLDLRFGNGREMVGLPGVAIAEVKQEGINRYSDFVQQMRAMAIPATGFSKYCIGVALLYQDVKHNNFKAKLGLIEKLMGDDGHVYRAH
jgi:hypothetical protein